MNLLLLMCHVVAGRQKKIAFLKMFTYANSQYFRMTAANFASPYKSQN
jgi:hypothetical protein